MQISRGRTPEPLPSASPTETFTGTAWMDPVLTRTAEGNMVNSVTFTPGARTHWHHHERGQVLVVTAGRGWVGTAEGTEEIRSGDTVWAPPGERHWHGGTPDTVMTHLAVSLGTTTWSDAVGEDEYRVADTAPERER